MLYASQWASYVRIMMILMVTVLLAIVGINSVMACASNRVLIIWQIIMEFKLIIIIIIIMHHSHLVYYAKQ
jgi:hypothetical protein